MQITAPPIPFYRAASNRPPKLSSAAAVRLKLLEQCTPQAGLARRTPNEVSCARHSRLRGRGGRLGRKNECPANP